MATPLRRLCCAAAVALCQTGALAQAPQDWQALDARVTALYARGDLKEAIEAAKRALDTAGSPAQSGRSLDRLGFLYYTAGDLPNGERFLRQSLEVRESAFGPDSLEVAETANDLAMLHRDLRRMEEARAEAQRSVAIRQRLLGEHAPLFAESLNTEGTVYGLSGDYTRAVTQFERAVAIHEEQPAAQRINEEYGTLCINLAGTYQRLGKYDAAETAFRKGLDALRVNPGVAHPAYAAGEIAFASLEVDLGRFVEAEHLYDEGSRLFASELGNEHPLYATLLNNRGLFYQSVGNVRAAARDYQASLDLKKKLYGPDSALAVSTLRNLAQLTYAVDRARGEQLFAEAVRAYAALPNPPPFDYASVLTGLARAQRDRGDVSDARATLTQALDVSRGGLGEAHPLYASALEQMGLTLVAAGETAEGERRLREALAIAEQVHGPTHPDLAGFLDALADIYAANNDFSAAEPLYARSLDIRDRYWSDVLAIGSESVKAAALAAADDPTPRLIAFQAAAPQLANARGLAFEAVTRRKGRVFDQVRRWREQLAGVQSKAVRASVEQWQAILGCRASLTVALGYRDLKPALAGTCTLAGSDLEGRYEQLLSDLRSRWSRDAAERARSAIATLQERGDALETSLNRAAGLPPDNARVTVRDLQAALGADEALLEFVSYAAATPMWSGTRAAAQSSEPSRNPPRRYGVFVLTRSSLEWSDLGAAGPIDSSVSDLLAAAADWSISVTDHEAAAVRASVATAEDAMAALSQRIWARVAPLVDRTGVDRLRIAPDGLLNLVPFEALSDRRQLIDRFTISYLPAGRDLITAPALHSATAPVVVVSPGGPSSPDIASRVTTVGFRADPLAPLSDAVSEAADVRRLVAHAQLYSGTAASEQHVKRLHGPGLLHVVGHGVLGSAAGCGQPCVAAPANTTSQAMALAAIVLEEAYGRAPGSPDDGLLTALELQNIDLRGTEMVVLSQCQMASGAASIGEGVYGMRRAAAVAGARTFVAPLWNVDDSAQRRLMSRFYDRLAAGEDRASALRRAKLALRQSPTTSSFLYWSPVILSGASGPLPASLFR